MHDPSTVAFTIPRPWPQKSTLGTKRRYWPALITVWHEDPMDWGGKERGRSDDSCGWHTPHLKEGERETWNKRAEYQWRELFAKTRATADGESYARVCYDAPDCFTAVYWLWRHFKHEYRKGSWLYRQPWQYGNRPSASEMEAIMNLATNPVDNLQFCFVHDAPHPPGSRDREHEDFLSFYNSVHRAYRRHHRPWWKHPKWHFWHWRFQIHPWQTFRRWAFSRCAGCGKRFTWGYCPTGFSWDPPRPKWFRSEVGVYHGECAGMQMKLRSEEPAGTA